LGASVDAHVTGELGTNVKGAVGIVGPIGPVTVAGIPDTFHIHVPEIAKITIGADPVHISIDHLPKLQIGVDPLELRLTELPSTRTHLPADFHVGLSVLGRELMCVRLCGEAQMISEPYHPNPCERCGSALQPQTPVLAQAPKDG
jgi:hypothetical protein